MKSFSVLQWLALALSLFLQSIVCAQDAMQREFESPPDSARPWVYWYFMDGHISRSGITADLESWKKAGIGGGIFLTVNVGIPRGPVDFMSEEWQKLFVHALRESDRLGLELALGAGPGWCGTGGPWIRADQSMQHLVLSVATATGPEHFRQVLPKPIPRVPFFGLGTLTPTLRKEYEDFYSDVAVIAFPTPEAGTLANVDETALYYRAPYSSQPGVKPFLPLSDNLNAVPAEQCIPSAHVIELTDHLRTDGTLDWQVPAGNWTILRCGRTSTGQVTRPAPEPGLGFESDKLNRASLDVHYKAFLKPLLSQADSIDHPGRGLTMLHFDSWEMSSQNWSVEFRKQFMNRRGYDPLKYLPAMSGRTIDNSDVTQRFLWDLRQTLQELTLDNHLLYLKQLGQKHHLTLSIEPYDLDPCADLNMGSAADLPMCEFWSPGYGFPTEYSVIEATSIAHVQGKPIVGAEAFTAGADEAWHQFPGSMKAQTDWAFAAGVNKIVFHRYQHQDEPTREPGMTMGPYGVHWERTETWWDFVGAYHRYIARCSEMLRKGTTVADVLYLAPEGAPLVFRPPPSALTKKTGDRRGYNFDGCDPHALIAKASVVDGRIAFPGGSSYRLLVLPELDTITPELLGKIQQLLQDGATVMGAPPMRSPSLVNYPACDKKVRELADEIWSGSDAQHAVGKGLLIRDHLPTKADGTDPFDIYPSYDKTAAVLASLGVWPDFQSDDPIRYTHRRVSGATEADDVDIYFVANPEEREVATECHFRITGRQPEWWDPQTGASRDLPDFHESGGMTTIPITFDPLGSGFVIFRRPIAPRTASASPANFDSVQTLMTLSNQWEVSFDPARGGPGKVAFDHLVDWTTRPEPGIKFYSGKATYKTKFDVPGDVTNRPRAISLGQVCNIASVKLNGHDLGVAWCTPWRVQVPADVLRSHGNTLEITVANLWINRLIGDSSRPEAQRISWTTYNPYHVDSPLQPSGLLGPVTLTSR
ncbi:MAG TPA: glycosyl hydrolase [Tepidisphaeraceae bacterium]